MISAHSSVDWGNVPAWFGAVLTGGSLLLGFYLLLRDRRKEDRYQANRIAYWQQQYRNTSTPARRYAIRVGVRNASDRPIYGVWRRVRPIAERRIRKMGNGEVLDRIKAEGIAKGADFDRYSPYLSIEGRLMFSGASMPPSSGDGLDASELLPGDAAKLEIEIVYPYEWHEFELVFRDSSNVTWRRNILTNELKRDWPQGNHPSLLYSMPPKWSQFVYRLIPNRFVNFKYNFINRVAK